MGAVESARHGLGVARAPAAPIRDRTPVYAFRLRWTEGRLADEPRAFAAERRHLPERATFFRHGKTASTFEMTLQGGRKHWAGAPRAVCARRATETPMLLPARRGRLRPRNR